MKRLGVIVNPIAGMGGRCGLKGTDGVETYAKACALGAQPEAPGRAVTALRRLCTLDQGLQVLTVSGDMGESEARAVGLDPVVLFSTDDDCLTTSDDTTRAAREMVAAGVDLILFAGGDGTARDVCTAVGDEVVTLGIPAGCKVHSGVYGINPRSAGDLAALYLAGRVKALKHAEVMDIDEEAFRQGRVTAELFGYLTVPADATRVQGGKAGRAQSDESALNGITCHLLKMDAPGVLYILGTGSTLYGVKQRFGIEGSLLGVDVVRDGMLVASDVTESKLLELLGPVGGIEARIVVTVIGGQGYIFGRGNQQISPRVIERVGRQNIVVVATKQKIAGLGGRPLLVDTGSEPVNELLAGYMRVIVGYHDEIVVAVSR